MIILSVNAGSSSLKFSLFEMPEGVELVNGYFEKIGLSDSFYSIKVNGEKISALLNLGILPVFAPLTFDSNGQILNTNADTIAGELAKELAKFFDVTLIFCFEKKGVLTDINDENSVIKQISADKFEQLKAEGVIQDGMIPKLENAFDAIRAGVKQVIITKADAIGKNEGTTIIA